MLKENFKYKLAALGIAVVIWVYAGIGQNPRSSKQIKDIPLQVVKVEPGYIVTSAPQTVDVIVKGARADVNSIASDPESITAYVNLQGKIAGQHILPVRVGLAEGYRGLISATPVPREVRVTLETKVQRLMAIDVQFTGSPPLGYRFGAPQLSPAKAVVSGRAATVNQVAKLVVDVDANNLPEGDIDGNFVVIAVDKNGKRVQGVEIIPERIHLSLKLLEAPASRLVFVSIDTNGLPPFPYKVENISISPQTVTVTGKPESLASVTTIKTEPIRLTGRTRSFSQKVRLVVPPNIQLADQRQVRVSVKIGIEETPETETPQRTQSPNPSDTSR
jgi:YbbR domain-containing protein